MIWHWRLWFQLASLPLTHDGSQISTLWWMGGGGGAVTAVKKRREAAKLRTGLTQSGLSWQEEVTDIKIVTSIGRHRNGLQGACRSPSSSCPLASFYPVGCCVEMHAVMKCKWVHFLKLSGYSTVLRQIFCSVNFHSTTVLCFFLITFTIITAHNLTDWQMIRAKSEKSLLVLTFF